MNDIKAELREATYQFIKTTGKHPIGIKIPSMKYNNLIKEETRNPFSSIYRLNRKKLIRGTLKKFTFEGLKIYISPYKDIIVF